MKEENKTVNVTEYTCEFCYDVKSYSKRKVEAHEKRCASRPIVLTPYEWGEKEVNDSGIGKHAEELMRRAIRDTPLFDYESDGSGIDLELLWDIKTDLPIFEAGLVMKAKEVEDVMAILKKPEFMKQVQKNAEEMREKAVYLIGKFAKSAKVEIPTVLEEKDEVPKDRELDER